MVKIKNLPSFSCIGYSEQAPRFPEGRIQATSCSPSIPAPLRLPGASELASLLPSATWSEGCLRQSAPPGSAPSCPPQPPSPTPPQLRPILVGLIARPRPASNLRGSALGRPSLVSPQPQPEGIAQVERSRRPLPASPVAFSVRWARPSAASFPSPPSIVLQQVATKQDAGAWTSVLL